MKLRLARSQSSSSDGVDWISPTADDNYAAGDTIKGSWTSSLDFNSPTFKLCYDGGTGQTTSSDSSQANMSGGSSCGQAVTPTVSQDGQTYSVNLRDHSAVPNMSSTGTFHLKMQSDDGDLYESPNFSLSPVDNAAAPDSSGEASSVQTTSANSHSTPSVNMVSTSSGLASSPSPISFSAAASSGSTAGSIAPTASSVSPSGPASMSDAHIQAPVAALAVPLSLCGALLLVSIFMFLGQRSRAKKSLSQPLACTSSSVGSILPEKHIIEPYFVDAYTSLNAPRRPQSAKWAAPAPRLPSLRRYEPSRYDSQSSRGWDERSDREERRSTREWRQPSRASTFDRRRREDYEYGWYDADAGWRGHGSAPASERPRHRQEEDLYFDPRRSYSTYSRRTESARSARPPSYHRPEDQYYVHPTASAVDDYTHVTPHPSYSRTYSPPPRPRSDTPVSIARPPPVIATDERRFFPTSETPRHDGYPDERELPPTPGLYHAVDRAVQRPYQYP
ncbi:hypothetical protein SISSUDRAFT_1030223 [Sistotremastrum suecicum HHB10207 ss-3]|uniref:Uncharacterized protein n=1 Tax=Sistotremastrum suecicum HHB10207 ss-3 TaxID=1314776 RepID=A0A166HHI5_9AGAM|nr:hypothetical protein SISSUDRAFT_1030223 [Sistotremastrum suecicum HHB10207 ss-3]